MIAKAPAKGRYGKDTYGLLRYLFGPGKSNEHTNQHLVAAWDPDWLDGGVFAERQRGWLARLAREIDAPMTGHSVQLDGGHVYHLVLSIPRQDGNFGDAQWRELVEEAMGRMGFGPTEDGRGGCRWVAVHHGPSKEGNDHIHVAINLVRGDGTVADTYRDWPRWRLWCREVEQRLGLTPTSPANKTAAVRPTRAEVEKVAGGPLPEPSRILLRKAVRVAAAKASSAAEFIEVLGQDLMVSVHARWDDEGRLTGYRVALFGDWSTTSPDGRVWFSGSSLAHDLSAPKLVNRWASIRLPADANDISMERHDGASDPLTRAARSTDSARQHLSALIAAGDVSVNGGGDDVAHAAADMLLAVSNVFGGSTSSALAKAVDAYEWVAVAPYRVQPVRWAEVAVELRSAARDLLRVGRLSKRASTGASAMALILALAALLAEIAAWRQLTGQSHQAAAARHAANLVNADIAVRAPHDSAPHHVPSGSPSRRAATTSGQQPDQRRTP